MEKLKYYKLGNDWDTARFISSSLVLLYLDKWRYRVDLETLYIRQASLAVIPCWMMARTASSGSDPLLLLTTKFRCPASKVNSKLAPTSAENKDKILRLLGRNTKL